jgi:hypothetical protein
MENTVASLEDIYCENDNWQHAVQPDPKQEESITQIPYQELIHTHKAVCTTFHNFKPILLCINAPLDCLEKLASKPCEPPLELRPLKL